MPITVRFFIVKLRKWFPPDAQGRRAGLSCGAPMAVKAVRRFWVALDKGEGQPEAEGIWAGPPAGLWAMSPGR